MMVWSMMVSQYPMALAAAISLQGLFRQGPCSFRELSDVSHHDRDVLLTDSNEPHILLTEQLDHAQLRHAVRLHVIDVSRQASASQPLCHAAPLRLIGYCCSARPRDLHTHTRLSFVNGTVF